MPQLGARPLPGGGTGFRVWAPRARRMTVEATAGSFPLRPEAGGLFAGRAPLRHGDDYRLRPDDGAPLPDPCSRHQPQGVLGPSRVVDPATFTWTDAGWTGLRRAGLAIMEIHVGTFTPEGTFAAAAARLPRLQTLGITAVELMPVATFPGRRGWGYDGLYTWAPHPAYGGPAGLAAFVDAAHAAGMGVILDVVHNHLGPGEEALQAFGPYLAAGAATPWGRRLDFTAGRRDGVREWAVQGVEMWMRDFHIDGLRADAVDAIVDPGPRHILAELTDRARGAARNPPLLIAESTRNGAIAVTPGQRGGWGFDAHWGDEFHHDLHAVLTGERDGYYAGRGTVAALARSTALDPGGAGAPPESVVVYAHNHDQVGNRALGDRLPRGLRSLALLWTLLAPGIPMLFMGDDDDEDAPFRFFTDHHDPRIADATRRGRRREFARFRAFSAAELPDPQDPATFRRSRVGASGPDPHRRALVRRLLDVRRQIAGGPATARWDEGSGWVAVRRGSIEVCGNFSESAAAVPVRGRTVPVASGPDARIAGGRLMLGAFTGAAVR